VSKACATAAVLFRPVVQAPVTRMVSALIDEVTNETTNTSMIAFSPCCTGRSLRAVP